MKNHATLVSVLIVLSPLAAFAGPSAFQIDYEGTLESHTYYGESTATTVDSVLQIGDDVAGRIVVDTDDSSYPSISLFEL